MESFYEWDLYRMIQFVGVCSSNALDEFGRNPLHYYAQYHCITALNIILPLKQFDINQMDCLGQTPLQMAIQNYNNDPKTVHLTVEKLLSYKADPNHGALNHLSPLMMAVLYQDLPLIRLLLSYGANPNQKLQGSTHLILAPGSTPFSIAAQRPLHQSPWCELDFQVLWLLLQAKHQNTVTPSTIFHAIQKVDERSKEFVLKLVSLQKTRPKLLDPISYKV